MKRAVAERCLFLAVAILALTSQVAVAAHTPAFHEEEAASKCNDRSEHFCAETSPDDAGRCLLCQAGLGGTASILVTLSESFELAEPAAIPDLAAPPSVLQFISAAPRAPPSLPA